MREENKLTEKKEKSVNKNFVLTDDVKRIIKNNHRSEWIIDALFLANITLLILGVGAIFYLFYRRLET